MSGPSDTPKISAIDPMDAELATLSPVPVPRLDKTASVSWKHQFSWKESGLCHDEDPLEENLFSDGSSHSTLVSPWSRFVNQGSSGWNEHSSSDRMAVDAAVVPSIDPVLSGVPVHSSGMDNKSATEPQNTDFVNLAMQNCVAFTVELLADDYIRVHAPQGLKGRAAGASQEYTESASNSRTGESSGLNRGAKDTSTSRKRKAIGDDGRNEGESEDENSQDKKKKSFYPEKDRDSHRWACPYAKWRPNVYTCNVRPKEIKDLKSHIFRVHSKNHCELCLTVYPDNQHDMAHICHPLDPGSIAPPGFITQRRRAEISQRESSSLSHEDQWYRLYGVLFPGERRCYNPYVNKWADEHLGRAEGYFRSERAQQILNQELGRNGFEGEIRRRVEEMIHDGFLASMIQEYDPNDERSLTPARRVLQEEDTTQSSQVEVSSTEITPPKFALESAGDETTLDHAEFGVLPGLDQVENVFGQMPAEDGDTYYEDPFESLLLDEPDLWYDNFEMDGNQIGLLSGT